MESLNLMLNDSLFNVSSTKPKLMILKIPLIRVVYTFLWCKIPSPGFSLHIEFIITIRNIIMIQYCCIRDIFATMTNVSKRVAPIMK